MSVKRCMREIDSAEFAEWVAYWNLEQFGPLREDERAGTIAALTANIYRDPKRQPDPFTAWDFFPRVEDLAEQAAEAMEAPAAPNLADKLMTWVAVMQDNKKTDGKGTGTLRPKKKKA